ncbi:MAG: hypothetical protein JXR76_03100 [Deltaproteobacteria bacterium]|nr:hypothetical protein [Deltaproteobacteria bacterium]
MNNPTKKQTNLGIALAIIGFAMVGGALVLVPQLVDEKVKSIQSARIDSQTNENSADNLTAEDASANSQEPSASAEPATDDGSLNTAATDSDSSEALPSEEETTGETAISDRSADSDAMETSEAVEEEAQEKTRPTLVETNNKDTFEIVLQEKYEPDAASQKKLDTIIAMAKSSPGIRLKVVGMNNINKMSKLAQVGANRIANIIMKEAEITPDRIEMAVEQKDDMKDIRVIVSISGGAQ